MALKLRRQAEVFTNGILPDCISGRPWDLLRTGADSFKRMLGSTLTEPSNPRVQSPIVASVFDPSSGRHLVLGVHSLGRSYATSLRDLPEPYSIPST